jgi:protein-tyrosine-phosphatase
LDLSQSHPKHLPKTSDHDLILSECADRARDVLARQKELHQLHWPVPDPVPSRSSEVFDLSIDVIAKRISALGLRIIQLDQTHVPSR